MEPHEYNYRSSLLKPFGRAVMVQPTEEHMATISEHFGQSLDEVRASIEELAQWPLFKNGDEPGDYQVQLREFEDIIHLSIKRIDKDTIHDWRHLQEIKNMLVGPEHEAIELYPAETRVVDTANQFHLWVFKDPTYRIPIGFPEGKKVAGDTAGARQRDFET